MLPLELPAPVAGTPAALETLLEVAYPGGMAPHYRVQTRSAGVEPQWNLVACFSDQTLAQNCLERLRHDGETARLVTYRRVPTAA
jgi:hypothetical protein